MTTKELISKLLEKERPEAIAVKIGRSVATISLWKAGKREASKGDKYMLERLYRG